MPNTDLARPLFPADRPRPVDSGEPGQVVITAGVPWPVWDQHAGVVVMPAAYTGQQAAAMVALVRERSVRTTVTRPHPRPRPRRDRLATAVHRLAGALASVDEHLVDVTAALERGDARAAGQAVEAAKRISGRVVEQARQVVAGGAR